MKHLTRFGSGNRCLAALLVGIVTAGGLTACGGGGSGSSESQTNAPTISKETITINTAEGQVEVRQLNGVIDPRSLTPVAGYDSPDISAVIANDTITVTVGDLENATQERFTILTDSNTRYTVVVSASNTSAEHITRQARALIEIGSARALVADDLRLLNTVLELEFLAREIGESEKNAIKALVNNAVDSSAGQLENEILLLDRAMTDYRDGAIAESDLQYRLDSANTALGAVGDAGAEAVGRVADTLTAMGIALPANLESESPLRYVAAANRYSRFMNNEYGGFDDSGNFRFAPAFDFFNAVFPFANQ